jgi:ubiquinone/menaquinone biosynthesis C-methylase UbiE
MHRRWDKLALQIARCWLGRNRTADLVCRSYDRIAPGYDQAWTSHMRDLSLAMLDRLDPPAGAACLDLTCGTGFITSELSRRTGTRATGVDASAGMLEAAGRQHASCAFVHADALQYLRGLRPRSFDVVTCGWGLGYTRPLAVVREIARVLRPGGRVGIIDNSLFSLAEVLWASMLAFAEQPDAMRHVMRVRFLPHSAVLTTLMRMHGLAVTHAADGAKTYRVCDGQAAIARLTATGAAAGFEFACDDADRERVFARFAGIVERRYATDSGIPVTHRYLMAVGKRVCANV